MSVFAWCEMCGCRRDKATENGVECQNKLAHKNHVAWIANWRPFRGAKHRVKKFGADLHRPSELAAAQERQWKTDWERGKLFDTNKPKEILFSELADKWWSDIVIVQGRIKDPNRSERGRFNMWVERFGNKLISDYLPEGQEERYLTMEDFEEWLTERRENGIAVNTINRDMKPLKWILDYAVTKRIIQTNPLQAMQALKGGNIHDRWMTEEEVGQLVQAAVKLNDYRLVDFIAVGVNTGFRLGNLERLTAKDIDGELLMARQTKSGQPYAVPIAPDIAPLLRRLVMQFPTGPLLPGRDNNIVQRFRAASIKAGLWKDAKDNDRVTIHTLRHTFAVLYLKRGGDIYKLSKLLGHASVAITDRIYARFCPKEKLAQAPLISTRIPQVEMPVLQVIG